MLRVRRYRVFVLLAVISLFLLYRLSLPADWESSSSAAAIKDRLGHFGFHSESGSSQAAGHKAGPPSNQDIPRPQQVTYQEEEKPAKEQRPKKPNSQQNSRPDPAPPKIPSKDEKQKEAPPPDDDIPKPTQKDHPIEDDGLASTVGGGKGSAAKAEPKTADGKDLSKSMPNPTIGEDSEIVLNEGGESRWSPPDTTDSEPKERWTPRPEHYPVPTQKIIALPTGAGKPIARIQHEFGPESEADKKSRLEKLGIIKEAFLHSWNGYKKQAWGFDELRPITGKSKNTFNGWGATLVDTMDTLWMMGLTKEFEECVDFVKKIDFYSSTRDQIPLFETTIRYLGGLLGAYDISDAKYPVLLEKAKELGEFLMAAFDTPNRMPLPYYPWMKAYASQPRRSTRALLAEIGSLQMEFTRLSQLTGDSKYYDAVARIVDGLEDMQMNTTIKGLWPTDLDISGCAKSTDFYSAPNRKLENTFTYLDDVQDNAIMKPLEKPPPLILDLHDQDKLHQPVDPEKKKQLPGPKPKSTGDDRPTKLDDVGSSRQALKDLEDAARTKSAPAKGRDDEDDMPTRLDETGRKRMTKRVAPPEEHVQEVPEHSIPPYNLPFNDHEHVNTPSGPVPSRNNPGNEECIKVGITAGVGQEKYTLGSTADSAFEYLTKQYVLLNGQVDKYRTMYERAIDAANKFLIRRIMIKDEKRILYLAGEVNANTWSKDLSFDYQADQSHLVCFAGGMYAMGAKLFDRPKDLDFAARLTDGCVWAYEVAATGIMPEVFQVATCESLASCPWNETAWQVAIDPSAEYREQSYKEQMKTYREGVAEYKKTHGLASSPAEKPAAAGAAAPLTAARFDSPAPALDKPIPAVPSKTTTDTESDTAANKIIDEDAHPAQAEVTSAQAGAREPPPGFDPHDHSRKPSVHDPKPGRGGPKQAAAPQKQKQAAQQKTKQKPKEKRQVAVGPDSRLQFAGKTAADAKEQTSLFGSAGSAGSVGSTAADELADVDDALPADAQLPVWKPERPQSRQMYVDALVREQRLKPGMTNVRDPRYLLRPEALESVFYMHRITGAPQWRASGWRMISAILKATRTPYGHAAVHDVMAGGASGGGVGGSGGGGKGGVELRDEMESFWLAETLKYAWLLFEDEGRWSLDEWVFNTEAHALRRPKPKGV